MMLEAASRFAPSRRNLFLNAVPRNGRNGGKGYYYVVLAFVIVRLYRSKRGKLARQLLRQLYNDTERWTLASFIGPSITSWVARPSPSSRNLDNARLVHSVLMYWFGQFEPDIAQKKLWMIASSSETQRVRIDQEIADKFESIIRDERYKEWNSELLGYQGKLATIIVLDQFSRHIHRHYDDTTGRGGCSLPSQSKLDALAFTAAKHFLLDHGQEIKCGMISLPMLIFALMPYRHANTLGNVQLVQQKIEEFASIGDQFDSMLSRFRKATNRRVAVLQDEARRIGHQDNVAGSDLDILETFPFEADMGPACEHVVHKTIVDFLQDRGITPGMSVGKDPFPVIVSLSGGVDSMVIASVLSHLANDCNYNLNLYAIHIDYANRPESAAEADYVRRYCEDKKIHFCLRRIDEVTRGITARDDYERIAREARYNCYRETIQLCKDVSGDSTIEVGVMLGHHRGDLRENVLSNCHKGSGPLDLSGMTKVSVNDRVHIYRPLLPLEKKEIFDYAHRFGVPYFKDTTPHWSTRGKLRNKLLPLLQEIYGEGSMNNLSNLAVESDQARDLLHTAVLGPFLEQVEKCALGIMFQTQQWKGQGLFFWKFVLREALHNASLGMFSDKSVETFVQRIQSETLKEGWLQCRRDYAVFLRHDGRVFVLFPDTFPFLKGQQFDCNGRRAVYGREVRVGPWSVTAKIVSKECQKNESALEKKAVPSWEALMNGKIKYYLEAPIQNDVVQPLVFVSEYQKKSRPKAWKNIDLKIQSTLPVLGNDEKNIQGLTDDSRTALVEVCLSVKRGQ